MTPPRNHAGFPSTALPGGTPEEIEEEYRELQREGFVNLQLSSVVRASNEPPNFDFGITEEGKQFLRNHGAAYLPEVTLLQLVELLKAAPKLHGDWWDTYHRRARFLTEETATYLHEQSGGAPLQDNIMQGLDHLRARVESMFANNGNSVRDPDDDRERTIAAAVALRNLIITGRTSPKL